MPAPTLITQHTRLVYRADVLAEQMGVSVPQITAWCNKGWLKARRNTPGIRGKWFTQADVNELLARLDAESERAA